VTRLAWVATALQLGVVGYRDPVGALSPDGELLAYAEGRHLRVVPVGGGAVRWRRGRDSYGTSQFEGPQKTPARQTLLSR
jgi:hypothetical protein